MFNLTQFIIRFTKNAEKNICVMTYEYYKLVNGNAYKVTIILQYMKKYLPNNIIVQPELLFTMFIRSKTLTNQGWKTPEFVYI